MRICVNGNWINLEEAADLASCDADVIDMVTGRIATITEGRNWKITDAQGFDPLDIVTETRQMTNRQTVVEFIVQIALGMMKHGEPFAAYVIHYGDTDEINFEETYEGQFHTKEEFAKHIISTSYSIPIELAAYIDFEALANDLLSNSFVAIDAPDGTIHVFKEV